MSRVTLIHNRQVTPINCPSRAAPWLAEARALVRLGGPVAVTQLMQMAVHTTDVIMVGTLGTEALAAAALGVTVYTFALLAGFGLASAVSPMIAHILGVERGDRTGVASVTRMGLLAVVLMTPPLCLFLFFTEKLLLFVGEPAELASAATPYVHALAVGLPFALLFNVLRNAATALSRPGAPLVIMAATIVVNGAGNYILIYGHFGAPALGLMGSGIASAFAYGFSFLSMAAVLASAPAFRPYRFFMHPLVVEWSRLTEIFRLGIPIAVTLLFEVMLFSAATLLMGAFGASSIAAHQIALNVPSITFMVPMGIAMAATVRVGLAAGGQDLAGVRRAGMTALGLSVAFMATCGVVIALAPRAIVGLYIDVDASDNTETVALAIRFLYVAAAFQIFDATQVTMAFALRGLKDTRVPMVLAGCSYWLVGFPLALLFAFGVDWEGLGVWIGLAASLIVASVAMSLRFAFLSGLISKSLGGAASVV